MIETANLNGFGINFLKTSKACIKLKGQLKNFKITRMSLTRPIPRYHFWLIPNWGHSPFKDCFPGTLFVKDSVGPRLLLVEPTTSILGLITLALSSSTSHFD
jgi:hypothetical protein